MTPEQPIAGGRIPPLLKQKLQAFCQDTGQSESQVIRAALSSYLGIHTPDAVQSLDKRVASLERKVAKLAQLM
jgi:predicted DNA-binding protein